MSDIWALGVADDNSQPGGGCPPKRTTATLEQPSSSPGTTMVVSAVPIHVECVFHLTLIRARLYSSAFSDVSHPALSYDRATTWTHSTGRQRVGVVVAHVRAGRSIARAAVHAAITAVL